MYIHECECLRLSPFLLHAGVRPPVGPDFTSLSSYSSLMKRCWDAREAERPSFDQVVRELKSLLDQLPRRRWPAVAMLLAGSDSQL
jgi:hypothetical protein